MCTVTLRCGAGSLLLTMNRDERYDRAPEEEPRRIPGEPGRPAWLAPFDSASGGTWIGVNERGVCSCLLNGYEPEDEELRKDPAIPSRGSIVPRILEEQDGVGPARLPAALDFSAYPSFTMLVASMDGGEIVRWRRGSGLTREEHRAGLDVPDVVILEGAGRRALAPLGFRCLARRRRARDRRPARASPERRRRLPTRAPCS